MLCMNAARKPMASKEFRHSGYHWLDSVHQRSFLPQGEWDELQKVLGYALARLIHQDFPSLSPGQRSALFHLLGRRFFETFMQSCKIEFTLSVDPVVLHEMKCYLEETFKQALKDSKLDGLNSESRPLKEFRKQLQGLYQKLLEDIVLDLNEQKHHLNGIFDNQQGVTEDPKLKMLLVETFSVTTTTSNLIGEGVNHILQRQPHLFEKVCFKLNGRQLPPSLRRTIWMYSLVSHNGKAKYVSEELVKEEFQQRLALKMAQLQIKTATSSPMRGLIKTMVSEKFKSTPCLQSLVKTSVSAVIEQAMNIYNVCSENCDPMSILLLFPMHMAFLADHADDKFAYLLALYVSLLELYVIPKQHEVHDIIKDVQDKIKQNDEELDLHLKSSVSHNRRSSYQENQGTDHVGISYILQQWIKEAFVGVLRKPAVMFVWDQLFLQKWNPEAIGNVCLSLILLLRENLLNDVKDLQSLIKVLSEEPSRLFTMDIQSAYQHISKGEKLKGVWKFNRKTRFDLPLEDNSPEDGLDFYIDGVRFLPDKSTITKVTGRVVDPFMDIPDVLALPDLDSDAKNPTYSYCYSLDSVEETNLIILRIYTVDPETKDIAIVGSCASALCEKVDGQPKVKCGCFQLRVKQGLPEINSHLTEEAFKELPDVPGCSVLIRIQPRSQTFIARPPYSEERYPYVFPLSEPERAIMEQIASTAAPAETGRDIALHLRRTDETTSSAEAGSSEVTDDSLTEWILGRLDKVHMQNQNRPVKQMKPSSLFNYNPKIGVKVKVVGGLGFNAENLYTGAMVRAFPADQMGPNIDDNDMRGFLVSSIDLGSSMGGPRWTEEPVLFHPPFGENRFLLVEIIGAKITPKRRRSDQNLGYDLGKVSKLAWTIVPFFEGSSVWQGRHILPLWKYKKSILESIINEGSVTVFEDAVKSNKAVLSKKHLFVEVEIFDGHFGYKDVTPLQEKTNLLVQTGQVKMFKTINESVQQGTHLSLLCKGRLSVSDADKRSIQETANRVFRDLVMATL